MDLYEVVNSLRKNRGRKARKVKASLRGIEIRQFFDLTGIDLSKATLVEADLMDTNLTEANLTKAKLDSANLMGAILVRADLTIASLKGADLCSADLRWTNLKKANLKGARLIGADLRQANLEGADLRGADFLDTDLSWANLTDAIVDQNFIEQVKNGEIIGITEEQLEEFHLKIKYAPKTTQQEPIHYNTDEFAPPGTPVIFTHLRTVDYNRQKTAQEASSVPSKSSDMEHTSRLQHRHAGRNNNSSCNIL